MHRYAVKQAEDDPLRDEYAERHARFYAERAAPLLDRQYKADWPDVVRRLLPDLPNLYQGRVWAAANRHPLAMDYFLHVAPYFSAFRDMKRWWEWTEVAREVAEANPAGFDAVDRFSLYSQLGWGRGTFEQRLAYLQQAHEIATTEMEPWHGVYTLTDLARLYSETGRLAEVEEAFLEAWQMAEASGRPKLRAWTLREIGLYYTRTLNRDGCVVVADRLAVTPPVDIAQGLKGAYDVASRGEVLAGAGRWAEALSAFREALAVHEATGNWVQGSEVRLEIAAAWRIWAARRKPSTRLPPSRYTWTHCRRMWTVCTTMSLARRHVCEVIARQRWNTCRQRWSPPARMCLLVGGWNSMPG